MPVPGANDVARSPRVHFCGIGGTAMVGGARLAVSSGWEVRGSDNPLYPPTSHMVEALGVPVATGYAAANLDWGPDIVVIGNALSRGNPEVEAVLERRLKYVSLPEWLKEAVLRPRRPVVIAGTHGKTTITALAAYLLDRAGFEPGYLVGGQPLDFEHSARLGREHGPFIIEGDEYDSAFFDKRAKFFHYLPEIAVISSIEFDHCDIYADIDEIRRAFRWMLRQVPASGHVIACGDNDACDTIKNFAPCDVLTYGLGGDTSFRGICGPVTDGRQRIVVHKQGRLWGEFETPLAGEHNARNTLAALAVADVLGAVPEKLAPALREFKGVKRRMEIFIEARGVTFVDDFAHHPTAIYETVRAMRARWPDRRLRVFFEPRSNTTVTNVFQQDLCRALSAADEACIGPIHRPERVPERDRLDRDALAGALRAEGVDAWRADDTQTIVARIRDNARPGDIVLILSNGAFGGIYGKLRKVFSSG